MPSFPALAYATTSPNQLVDLVTPDGPAPEGGFPLVISIHGGAFRWGDRSKDVVQREALLAAGVAFASVGYRLSGEATYPAAVDDVREATRFLRLHAPTWSLNPHRFASWGRSAGGYLAAALGLIPETYPGLDEGSVLDASARVSAVVDWYGPSDFLSMDEQFRTAPPTSGVEVQWHHGAGSPESDFLGGPLATKEELARQASVLTWVKASTKEVAFSMAAGDQDPLVPHQQSLALVDALSAKGYPVIFTLLEGAGHAGPRFEEELGASTIAWLLEVL